MNCRGVHVARSNRKIDCAGVGSFETMCNQIAQAFVLNDETTEFNIVMGLCVGHDSLFLKYSNAPCTVAAAIDRRLGHNPLAAIYTIDSYYSSLKHKIQAEKWSPLEKPTGIVHGYPINLENRTNRR